MKNFENIYNKCLSEYGTRIIVSSKKNGLKLLRNITTQFPNLEGNVYKRCSSTDWILWVNIKS